VVQAAGGYFSFKAAMKKLREWLDFLGFWCIIIALNLWSYINVPQEVPKDSSNLP
jgi:hypothetical protein